jgi:hypothetical protein
MRMYRRTLRVRNELCNSDRDAREGCHKEINSDIVSICSNYYHQRRQTLRHRVALAYIPLVLRWEPNR